MKELMEQKTVLNKSSTPPPKKEVSDDVTLLDSPETYSFGWHECPSQEIEGTCLMCSSIFFLRDKEQQKTRIKEIAWYIHSF